jgi:hypothetical protein
MCSDYILLNNSCYLDDFLIIGTVFAKAIVLGLIIGTVVGVLLLFIKKINQ